MNFKWVSLNEACEILGISLSTLRRRIDASEFESKLEGKKRLVSISDEVQVSSKTTQVALIDQLRQENDRLNQQLAEKDKQIENLQIQLQDASQRHDTVVMQITKMLEYERQPFWRRWLKHKALPAPGDVMDMKPGTAEEATPEETNSST